MTIEALDSLTQLGDSFTDAIGSDSARLVGWRGQQLETS